MMQSFAYQFCCYYTVGIGSSASSVKGVGSSTECYPLTLVEKLMLEMKSD
jgi:hypothetical protein